MANVNFKIISLNARGIRDLNKRKAIFSWLQKQKADIAFLQETYSTPDVVEKWKFQWPGKIFYSHGTNHDRAEKRLRMCGLSWRAQPGNNNKPYKNGGVFKILRVASSFSRKSRVCLETVD